MAKNKLTYREAGVDITANTRWVNAIKAAMTSTYGPRVCSRHNAFAGLFRLDYEEQLFRRNYRRPVLIGCADGVGTKVLIALEMGRLDTIGIDLVAMNVNDLITCGGEPLFFLDYLAVSKLDPAGLLSVIEGIAEGCRQAECTLLGGETAEMPDLYHPGHIDLAGFAVGVVELGRVVDGTGVRPGDVIIGLPSSGVHSNGYTLVRKLIAAGRCKLDAVHDDLGEALGEALLRPTRIYVKPVLAVLHKYQVKRVVTAMAHITGGGLRENIERVLPAKCEAVLDRSTWRTPPIFAFLRRLGTTRAEMYKVFNMGIGFVMMVRPHYAAGAMDVLREAGENPIEIGVVERGRRRVQLVGRSR
ncbi:MAG TPA: phosphoribosylformylglycinamidine cyclo-ligase [Phycisphaerae bacterium]|nr:phosphoribosylformylglycinamidine cyclo-ligase [Phycisphaerae bacterium]HNU44330.1 phosphoribosylformylglycinamidine cyclo-ligase [Phycisphaerae bacterium]